MKKAKPYIALGVAVVLAFLVGAWFGSRSVPNNAASRLERIRLIISAMPSDERVAAINQLQRDHDAHVKLEGELHSLVEQYKRTTQQ